MAHSRRGFSSQSVIFACSGHIRMTEGINNGTNELAEIGTAVHECAEAALNLGSDCRDFVGLKFNNIKITDEMAASGQVYVDYVRKLKRSMPGCTVLLEKRVILSSISAEDLWGTSDCIIIYGNKLFVGDYKNGYGVVEVDKPQYVHATNSEINGNAQCIGYALAALDTFNLWSQITEVTTFIGQPNYSHVDGSIRSKTYSMEEVRQWWDAYYYAYHASKDPNAPLNAGNHCKYCAAAGFCAPRIERTMNMMKLNQGMSYLTPDQIVDIYHELKTIRNGLERIEEQATILARQGKVIEGYKLVKGIARAICTDEEALVTEAINKGVDKDKLFNTKLKGKTDLKKVVDKRIVDKYFKPGEASSTLVPLSNSRAAIAPDQRPDATGIFSPIKR